MQSAYSFPNLVKIRPQMGTALDFIFPTSPFGVLINVGSSIAPPAESPATIDSFDAEQDACGGYTCPGRK